MSKSSITIKRITTHPGEVLREDFLLPKGITGNALSLALRIPATRIHAILNGRRGITPDTAMRLERYFGVEAEFWMNLQSKFDLTSARAAKQKEIEREILSCV